MKLRVEQSLPELDAFAMLLQSEGVTNFLEVGSREGGSLYRIAQRLPGCKLTSIDLVRDATRKSPVDCIAQLCSEGHDAQFIQGDSTDANVIAQVITRGPFDAVFIDGNHTYDYVHQDWLNYGPLARIVAFHDVGWAAGMAADGDPIEVPRLWAELKPKFRHVELIFNPGIYGIGMLWHEPSLATIQPGAHAAPSA